MTELARKACKKRNREGTLVTKRVDKTCGDGNCGPASLLKAVKSWGRDAKKGLKFRDHQDIREQVAEHAKNLTPALREQFFEGRYQADASPAEKAAFVGEWAQEAQQDRAHVELLFCRLFADMMMANLTVWERRDDKLVADSYKLLHEDSEVPREAIEGREIELFYSSFLHGGGQRTGHYDLVKTSWA